MATNTSFVKWPTFDEMKEMFKEHFIMERREDGVVLVRMHTNGESQMWSMELHDAIGKMWRLLGTDRETECIIFTGTGENWICEFEPESWAPEKTDPAGTRYNHMFIDGRRMLIAMIQDCEVPSIGAIIGRGGHPEIALMCDIAIMADTALISDPHFVAGIVPGDGIQDCLFELMGTRRAVYMMLMHQILDPKQCLEYGLINEIVPEDKLLDRAYEIADVIMAQPRTIRRLTTQVIRRPWKKRIVDDLDMTFGTEMFGDFCNERIYHSDFDNQELTAKEKYRLEAIKRGLIKE